MKKLLVVSDTHGNTQVFQKIIQGEPEAEALIFLGDCAEDVEYVKAHIRRRLPAYVVRGNCDIDSPYPAEGLAAFEGTLIFYTHGHLYDARGGPSKLSEVAAQRGADCALCGHTHVPDEFRAGPIPVFNPGSPSRPRSFMGPTYGLLTLERGQEPQFEIKQIL